MPGSPRHRSSTLKPPPTHLSLHPDRPASPACALFSGDPTPRPASPTPTQHVGGLRAHFAHLLPRHAAFTVTLTLHQLNNVPLVHGEFGLQWKIKGVTSHSGSSLLDKVKGRKPHSKPCNRPQPSTAAASAKGSDTDNASLFDAASVSDAHSIANSSSAHSHSNDHLTTSNGASHVRIARTQPLPIPSVVVSTNYSSSSPMTRSISFTSSVASMSSASSIHPGSPHLNGHSHPPGYLSADWSRQGPAQRSVPSHDIGAPNCDTIHSRPAPAKLNYSPAKGITPFVKLKEHNIVWEKQLKFVVQMSVSRDSGELGECVAKFIVMQRVVAGDPDAPRNPRLGVVYLNLAQYAEAGVVTRRYLLRKSKTNATLKLSVHLEHTAGDTSFVAPPLPKAEILSGVAGFLESSDVYRTRTRASDLYAYASSDSSSEDVVVVSGSDTSSIVSGSGISSGGPSHDHSHGEGHHCRHAAVRKQRRPFEISKLSVINDPRGTEKMIEALFNPVPVTHASKVTPFTYLVGANKEGDGDEDADGEHNSYGADRPVTAHEEGAPCTMSLARGEGDDDSLYADSPHQSADERDGFGSDYHSLRSHPSFQGSLRSKHSTRSLKIKVEFKDDDAAEEIAASTGVRLLSGVTERRTWWQKVLSPPSVG